MKTRYVIIPQLEDYPFYMCYSYTAIIYTIPPSFPASFPYLPPSLSLSLISNQLLLVASTSNQQAFG